ncbi:dihydrofolate reductase family protein [Microbacterium sp.]|uniref:dihydrofolate reductase family protein n=1 Tax=Microbacterium sp. TaxID=51671 RepID=UPI0028113C7E|nr:dihydrofolate reductase family protein [Microbacterium sp.]
MFTNERRIVANIAVSLDGYYQGPGGPADMGWLMPYAISDTSRDHLTSLWKNATTALLGRTNAEGFFAYWPTVADDENADARDRGYGAWMRDAEKVVLSSSLESAPWSNTRIFDEPAEDVVKRLKAEPGGDIVVFASASVIRALLAADALDRLSLTVFPQILGGGERLFDGAFPPSAWTLANTTSGEDVLSLSYDRRR